MSDPREAVALALRGLADTLRHHRDLGLRDLTLSTVPFPDPGDALREQERARQGCQLCKLGRSRTNVAFGSGDARARLMVVGEGPGEEEDKQGLPFVGRAGQLLTKMLASVGFDRERDCYIANVVKCRPERNRNPEPDEVAACSPYLVRQIELLRPKVILALGTFAAQTLLQTRDSIGKLRGRIHRYYGVPLIVTYHPAALLRNPAWKRPTWEDVQLARRLLDRTSGA
jgi:DNA polymerase